MSRRSRGRPLTGRVRVHLSGVASLAHVVYAASYLRGLLAEPLERVTVVDLGVRTFLGRANVSAADLEELLPHDARLRRVRPSGAGRGESEPGESLVYLAVGAPGIKPYLRLRRAHPTRRIHVVVVDEGLGSYGTWRTRRDAWRREGGREPWPTVRALAVAAARHLLTDERWALYERDRGQWQLHDAVAAEFRGEAAGSPDAAATVVFLSQPWVELGLVTKQAYTRYLEVMAESCRARGLAFAVRPHPAEDESVFAGHQTVSSRVPAELDARITSARAVVGVSSTALLNLAAIHGTPAVRLALPELAPLEDELAEGQRSLLDRFLPPARPPAALADALPPGRQV